MPLKKETRDMGVGTTSDFDQMPVHYPMSVQDNISKDRGSNKDKLSYRSSSLMSQKSMLVRGERKKKNKIRQSYNFSSK